jgi:hypothetical protein
MDMDVLYLFIFCCIAVSNILIFSEAKRLAASHRARSALCRGKLSPI